MKCKRCRAFVPDDVDTCPMCGEDLTFLRQLLKSVYEEEPKLGEEKPPPPISEDKLDPSQVEPIEPTMKSDEPRVILNSEPLDLGADYRVDVSIPPGFGMEEPPDESLGSTIWDHALRGGFWRRFMAFGFDQILLLLLMAIFVVSGFIAAQVGSGPKGMSFLKQARVIIPMILPMAAVLWIAYFTFFHVAWGQTVGKMIYRVRTVQKNGQPLTYPQALLRTLCYLVSALPLFLGFFWAGFTSSKRSWHDLISGTIVVREQ